MWILTKKAGRHITVKYLKPIIHIVGCSGELQVSFQNYNVEYVLFDPRFPRAFGEFPPNLPTPAPFVDPVASGRSNIEKLCVFEPSSSLKIACRTPIGVGEESLCGY